MWKRNGEMDGLTVPSFGNFVRGFHVLAAAFITLAGWGAKLARQHVTASVVVPRYLGPRPFSETRFCQAEIHIEESQGGGSGSIGLVKLPSYKEMCRGTRWCWPSAALPFGFAPRVFSSKYLELCWWQGPVSEYLVMLTYSLPVAGLVWKQETAKSSSWMGYLPRLLGIVPNLTIFCMDLLGVNIFLEPRQAVSPQNGNPHRQTLIYLHGLGGAPLRDVGKNLQMGGKWLKVSLVKKSAWLKCWFSHWNRTLLWKHIGSGVDYLQADSELLWPWRLGASYAPGLRAVFPSAPLLQQPWGETLGSWSLGQWTNMVRWPDGLSVAFSKSKPWRRQVSICWYH